MLPGQTAPTHSTKFLQILSVGKAVWWLVVVVDGVVIVVVLVVLVVVLVVLVVSAGVCTKNMLYVIRVFTN